MNILLADDEPLVLELMGLLLHRAGHTVHASPDGREALDVFRHESFDLVITDLAMPGLDGLQLARRIKTQLPHQPVVLLTGAGEDEVLPPDVDFMIAKPIRDSSLTELLRRVAAKIATAARTAPRAFLAVTP